MTIQNFSELLERSLTQDQAAFIDFKKLEKDTTSLDTMVKLALFYQKIGPYQNHRKAIRLLERAAKLGNPEALYQLSYTYSHGIGCKPNQAKSYACYEQAMILKHELSNDPSIADEIKQWENGYHQELITENKTPNKSLQKAPRYTPKQLCDLALKSVFGTGEDNGHLVDYNLASKYCEVANIDKKGHTCPLAERIYPNKDTNFLKKLALLKSIQFDSHLNAIKQKMMELAHQSKSNKVYCDSAYKLLQLHRTLIKATKDFIERPLTKSSKRTLQTDCSNAIQQAKSSLKILPGWCQLAANVLNVLVFILIGGVAHLVNKLAKGRYNLFTPTVLVKIEAAETAIEQIGSLQKE